MIFEKNKKTFDQHGLSLKKICSANSWVFSLNLENDELKREKATTGFKI